MAVPSARRRLGSLPGRRGRQIVAYAVVILFLLWVLLPLVVVLENSLKPTSLLFTDPPTFIFWPTLDSFARIMSGSFETFQPSLANSALVAVSTTILSIALGTPAAYAFARLPMRGKGPVAQLILMSRMVPPVTLVVPFFVLFATLRMINTYWALIISYTTFNLPLVIWTMRSFFEELPAELEEAARVDGATRLEAFIRIALPLTGPGLAATTVLALLASWNELLFAVVLSGSDTRTMPVAVAGFVGIGLSIDWGGSAAAAILAMAPIFVLGLAVQRFFVRALTMGAVKG